MLGHLRRRLPPLACLGLLLAAVALAAPAAAQSSEQAVELSAKPVDQPGEFFDLTLEPGQSTELQVELGNQGAAAIVARTYAADVYTIINGGFGAELREGSATGTTTWLGYPTEVLQLEPGRATVRTFTVSVPPATPPGEYITSLVLENDAPIQGEGSVTLNQVVRQAVAVAIRVPGQMAAGLAVGAASHTVSAERSVVAVAVSNTGSMRLTPTAELVLRDEAGAEVSRGRIVMDSFYAQSETKVELPLATLLLPGTHTVDLTLVDEARGARAEGVSLPLEVTADQAAEDAEQSVGAQVADVLQARPGGVPVWAVAAGVLVPLLALAAIIALRPSRSGRRERRHVRRS